MKSFTSLFLLLLFAVPAFAKDVKTEIKVSGMTCGACSVSVQSALTRIKGVKSAAVSNEKGLATVVYDDEPVSYTHLTLPTICSV